jgi:DNA-binding MarR family transcriptional regulator
MRKTQPTVDAWHECVCFNLRAAARTIAREYDEALAEAGLTNSQFSILAALSELGPQTSITRLSDALAMDRSTLTRNLKPLEQQGLVKRGAERYRRARSLELSPRGAERLAAAAPLWRRVQEEALARVGAGQWERMREELEIVSARGDHRTPRKHRS